MAARTCLLCGKTLSRIWAGTGEDFCSREHRNQYRLRRGMDRLLEANRVASVMRRREQPKHIPASELRVEGLTDPRGFLAPLRGAPPQAILPVSQLSGCPGLESASDYLQPRAVASGRTERRTPDIATRFTPPRMRAPSTSARSTPHVLAAPPAGVRPRRGAPAERRPANMQAIAVRPPMLASLLSRGGRPAGALCAQARPPRSIAIANTGLSLRVSTAAAFRFREKAIPSTHAAPPGVALIPPAVKGLTKPAAPAEAPPLLLTLEASPGSTRIPPAPEPILERRFRWPEALETTFQFRNTADGWRISAVPFGVPDESAAKERR